MKKRITLIKRRHILTANQRKVGGQTYIRMYKKLQLEVLLMTYSRMPTGEQQSSNNCSNYLPRRPFVPPVWTLFYFIVFHVAKISMNQFKFIVCLWCVRVDYPSNLEREVEQHCMYTLGLAINVHCHLINSGAYLYFVFENWIPVDETLIILYRLPSIQYLATRNLH